MRLQKIDKQNKSNIFYVMSENIIVELGVPLDSETRKEIADDLKRRNLIHSKFVGKVTLNINQGGITSITQSVKASREELGKLLAAKS